MTDLEEIYVEYFEPVYKFLISLGCDSHSAEEITQETIFIAIQKIDSFKGNCKLSVWLCQIAKNMYFKKRKEGQKFIRLDFIVTNELFSVFMLYLVQIETKETIICYYGNY